MTSFSQRLLTTLSVSALLLGASVTTTQASPEKQAELRTEISELLASQNLQLDDGKTIEIVEEDNYYIATIPSMSAKVDGKTRYIAPGAVINARPKDAENWEMKYKLVSPIRIFGQDSSDEMKIFIDDQDNEGVWNASLNNFTYLKSQFEDVSLRDMKEGIVFKFDDIDSLQRIEKTGDNLYSAKALIELKDMTGTKNNTVFAKLRELKISSIAENADIQKIQSLASQIFDAADPNEKMQEHLADFIYDSEAEISIKDVSFIAPEDSKANFEGDLIIPEVKLVASLKDSQTDKADLKLSLKMIRTPFENDDSLIPQIIDFDINAENIPLQEFIAQEDLENPDQDAIKNAFFNSGFKIGLNSIKVMSSQMGMDFAGDIKADKGAMLGITSSINGTIKGLDAMIKMAKQKSADAPGEVQKGLSFLPMLQLFGQKQGDKDIWTYDIDVAKDGSVKINGADMSAMMGAMSGKQ